MLRPGQAIAICVLALLTLGVVMVNSAGMTVDPRQPPTVEGILLSRPAVYAGLAVIAMACCALAPIRRLVPRRLRADGSWAVAAVTSRPGACWSCGYDRRGLDGACPECGHGPLRIFTDLAAPEGRFLSPTWIGSLVREYVRLWPLWAGCAGLIALLATVYVPGIERPRNGSHRWITLHIPGLDSIQPSELAKWGLVVLIAWYAARYAARMRSFWLGLVPGLAAAGVVAAAVVVEDLGTGALMGMAACVVLLAAGARLWQLLILLPIPLAGAALAIVTNPYRMHRIESFMNPYLEPRGKGFHMIQSMLAVAGGQGFGRGLGHGLQKFDYLPEDTTDFLFAIICEELGIAGAALVMFLFAALAWSIWGVIRRERAPVLKLLALGVLATIGIQAVINLAVVTGMGPAKGIALPLLSNGGTGWILTAAALGLVIAIDRTAEQGAIDEREAERDADLAPVPAFGAVAATAAMAGVALTELKTDVAETGSVAVVEPAEPDEAIAAAGAGDAATEPEPAALAATGPETIPGEPGRTGLLFDLETPPPSSRRTVVVTDAARTWIDDAPSVAASDAPPADTAEGDASEATA